MNPSRDGCRTHWLALKSFSSSHPLPQGLPWRNPRPLPAPRQPPPHCTGWHRLPQVRTHLLRPVLDPPRIQSDGAGRADQLLLLPGLDRPAGDHAQEAPAAGPIVGWRTRIDVTPFGPCRAYPGAGPAGQPASRYVSPWGTDHEPHSNTARPAPESVCRNPIRARDGPARRFRTKNY